MTHRCTLHVTVDDPADLAAIVEAVEGLGHRVDCSVFDEWTRRRTRDERLREAHAVMDGTPWARCVALEREIHRFEALVWTRWRELEAPPEPCSELRRHLFEAHRLGPLPTTARQLWNIVVKGNARCDFREKAFHSATRDPE